MQRRLRFISLQRPRDYPFEFCFLRSAHRFFIASAIRLRPSGLSLRLFRGDGVVEGAFLLPLGRPRPAGAAVPASSARGCCNFDIWAAISTIMRLTSTCYLHGHRQVELLDLILSCPILTIQNEITLRKS